jgi:hypothetical protein
MVTEHTLKHQYNSLACDVVRCNSSFRLDFTLQRTAIQGTGSAHPQPTVKFRGFKQ